MTSPMRVLFATAELAPIERVGGMAEASAGLVKQLRADGLDVTVVLPDYRGHRLADEVITELDVPHWVGAASARTGTIDGVGEVTLVRFPGIERAHPYTDEEGAGFADNDQRFFGFSAAIAALVEADQPDVLHLNDWHTAAALGFLPEPPPSLLTIHTLGYQGIAPFRWLERLPHRPHDFFWHGGTNPLLGGIALADRVVTVSPNYAQEILSEADGMGLHLHLAALGERLHGIINGIDVSEWTPAEDEFIPAQFSDQDLSGKDANRTALLESFGLDTDMTEPVIGMVTRLVDQKGIDLVASAGRFLENIPARLVVLGSGDRHLASMVEDLAARYPDRVAFFNGYDITLAHLVFAGADMLLVPSRFEPCGLAQMQAMAYGTIPVVTDVGGLHDTVIDADRHPRTGTGFVSEFVDEAGVLDALYRAARGWKNKRRRLAMQKRAMSTDWSWASPASKYESLYLEMLDAEASTADTNPKPDIS